MTDVAWALLGSLLGTIAGWLILRRTYAQISRASVDHYNEMRRLRHHG